MTSLHRICQTDVALLLGTARPYSYPFALTERHMLPAGGLAMSVIAVCGRSVASSQSWRHLL